MVRTTIREALSASGHEVTVARDGEEASRCLAERRFDLLITDVRMPRVDGLRLFHQTKHDSPATSVILMTAHAAVSDAVQVLKEGAEDYLVKPFDTEELIIRVQRLAERRRLTSDLRQSRALLERVDSHRGLVGRSTAMRRLFERLETIAPSDATVLILGESGTGKELVARAVHDASSRSQGPFVAVNCAAFPESLIEAELFGHARGAFTGAMGKRDGRFQAAAGGTLFLDEIGEMPARVQAKLLRVVQTHRVEPLGSDVGVDVDVRLVCATHRDLKSLIEEGRFRQDLFYRLNVVQLVVPPLRERNGDLPYLVTHFLQRFSPPDEEPVVSPRAWVALLSHSFPGNVRELEHAVQHAVILAQGGEIDVEHLPMDIRGPTSKSLGADDETHTLAEAMRAFERHYLLCALEKTGGRKAEAARLLGISRKTLWEKLKSHSISASEVSAA